MRAHAGAGAKILPGRHLPHPPNCPECDKRSAEPVFPAGEQLDRKILSFLIAGFRPSTSLPAFLCQIKRGGWAKRCFEVYFRPAWLRNSAATVANGRFFTSTSAFSFRIMS